MDKYLDSYGYAYWCMDARIVCSQGGSDGREKEMKRKKRK